MYRSIPTSQGELIRLVRGERTQKQFAALVGVDRTCLSRYESETLGAPTSVINYCLKSLSATTSTDDVPWPLEQALAQARLVVASLEKVTNEATPHQSIQAKSKRSQR